MKWYTDYLSAYEKPYSELPPPLTNRVKKRIRELQHPNPLVSVVVIAHNEENRIFSCLWSICENNCHFPIEIIVINNHSTDNTESIYNPQIEMFARFKTKSSFHKTKRII